jgi:hypothetical protein
MPETQLFWNCFATYLCAILFLTFKIDGTPAHLFLYLQEIVRGISFYYFNVNLKQVIKYLKYQL